MDTQCHTIVVNIRLTPIFVVENSLDRKFYTSKNFIVKKILLSKIFDTKNGSATFER